MKCFDASDHIQFNSVFSWLCVFTVYFVMTSEKNNDENSPYADWISPWGEQSDLWYRLLLAAETTEEMDYYTVGFLCEFSKWTFSLLIAIA